MIHVEIKALNSADIKRVILSGEFDLFDKKPVEDLLLAIPTDDCKAVIVDLSDVTHMDEAGVELLIYYLKKLTRDNIRMAVLVNPESRLTKKLKRLGIFENTGLVMLDSINEASARLMLGNCG